VTASPIPVDAKRQDWPRLVSGAMSDAQKRIADLEGGNGSRAKLRFLYG
jgi:hypothetical protein